MGTSILAAEKGPESAADHLVSELRAQLEKALTANQELKRQQGVINKFLTQKALTAQNVSELFQFTLEVIQELLPSVKNLDIMIILNPEGQELLRITDGEVKNKGIFSLESQSLREDSHTAVAQIVPTVIGNRSQSAENVGFLLSANGYGRIGNLYLSSNTTLHSDTQEIIQTLLIGVCLQIVKMRQNRDLENQNEQLRRQAVTDKLGMHNTRYLENQWEQITARLAREKKDQKLSAAIYMDLNNFKNLNDSQGHPAGDELLRQIYKSLAGAIRHSDFLIRDGGDEFMIILEDLDGEIGLMKVLERIAKSSIIPINDNLTISGSIGCLILDPKKISHPAEISLEEVRKQADKKMYEAKNSKDRQTDNLLENIAIGYYEHPSVVA